MEMAWRRGKRFKMQKYFWNKLDCMEKEKEIIDIFLFFQATDLLHKALSGYNEVWFSFLSGDKMKALQLEQCNDPLSSTDSHSFI